MMIPLYFFLGFVVILFVTLLLKYNKWKSISIKDWDTEREQITETDRDMV